ncbi:MULTISPECIES: acyl-CoA dehydrogenase family protein [unclassified Pseudactinotalea]|uniref:acyl-CoA dehydrogenase family protein n=1 Tax=unclassified Pseudactinotalea TaxID=2649176 RepID=UPI00128DBEEB|nr:MULTISPECIES: acyl-CoA dehydrogenase family protein [unclassified Pseudactinotalea]MPV50201.1 acyl-CoA dehydrogenase [Pseudactinotalea sp. HY160]QGH70212.1 acyl-CoA dehydrogenase [Pseudactinotalea sp. HY158]
MSLTDDLLDRIHARAAEYDRTNTFFAEDLADLAGAGYLRLFVPTEFGGGGLTLPEMTQVQMRLAGAAPATALSVNMHQVWVGVARTVRARGDAGLDWLFTDAAAGEVFGFGISEPGNDLVLLGSSSEARPVAGGGYTFHGTKIFTSNSPGWTKLGTFGLDSTDPGDPRNVYAFVDRAGGGFEVKSDWDTLGMRASQSCTTILDGAYAPPERVLRRLVPGPNPDPLVFGIFANFEILVASVYAGIAQRALDLAIEAVARRTSKAAGGTPYAHNPTIRKAVAAAAMDLDEALVHLTTIARDVEGLPGAADHGDLWFPRLSAVKIHATETARRVVDAAMRLSGGGSYFTRNELSRLYRDVAAGIFHPSSEESTHASWATALLGPIPD